MTASGLRHSSAAEPWRLSAGELLAAYARRELSPVAVVEDLLDRIEALNPVLNAYLAVDAGGALAAARAAERAWRGGEAPPSQPLCGVPVSVKDTIEISGMPTTYGSAAFRGHYAPDSEIGRRLRAAGAVIIGKTNTSEFALSTYTINRLGGPAANPWHPGHTAGGSSGGAGAAVAAGLAPIGIGTDSAGSIRLPAAYNGVFGLKPTFNAIPAIQMWRASPTRSHNGVLTRTVSDAALAMRVLARTEDRQDAWTSEWLRGRRIGVPTGTEDGGTDGADVVALASEALARLGADVVTTAPPPPVSSLPSELEPGVWAYSGEHYAAAEGLVADFWAKHSHDLTSYAYPIYEAGRRALAWQYRRVLDLNARYAVAVREWFDGLGLDFVLTPVAPEAPPQPDSEEAGGLGPRFPALSMWNITGNPAASVPMGRGPNDLPLAVQIVGRHGDDQGVLAVSAALERACPWRDAWPALATRVDAPGRTG